MDDRRERLKDFYYRIKDCRECELWKTKNRFVFGGGSAAAELLFIGEAPGKNEDLQGKPFVGRAGKILDDLLHSIGLDRTQVFIANVLKCRPPRNRDPRPEEIEACKGHLFKQVEIINPRIICTLGKHSTQLILKTNKGITGLRGNVFRSDGRLVLPINHPAAVLYSPGKYKILEEDFKKISQLLLEEEPPEKEPPKREEAVKDPEQLGLF